MLYVKLFLSQLSNREISFLIWVFILLIYLLSSRELRGSLIGIFKACSSLKIIIPCILLYLLLTIYTYCLYKLGLWEKSILKDTFIYIFLYSPIIMFNSLTNKEFCFKKVLLKNIGAGTVIGYYVSLLELPLFFEIILLPVVLFVVMCSAYAEMSSNPEHYKAASCFNSIYNVICLSLFAIGMYFVITHFNEMFSRDIVLSLIYPILLSPIVAIGVYFIKLYACYEELLIVVDFSVNHNKDLYKQRRKHIFSHCTFKLEKVTNARKSLKLFMYENEEEFIRALKTI